MSKNKLRIAIIGGGIGGTTAAGLLQRAGYQCTVYEQTPEFRPIGAGINFFPNGTRVFRFMGLESKMLRAGVQHKIRINRDWDTGRAFYTYQPSTIAEKYGAPFIAFHRAALHDALASAAAPETFQLGKRLRSLHQGESSIHLHFEDGTTATADAVIGADGVHSKVREAVLDPTPPVYSGRVAYRSVFPRALLSDPEHTDYTRWWAPDRYVVFYSMNQARDEVNLVTGGPEEWGSNDFVPMPVEPDRMCAAFEDFHPHVRQTFEKCTHVTRWPLLVRRPGIPWGRGPVTLLGDACHPMTPHLGQGAGMAVEDAMVLVRCLEAVNGEDPELAFRMYETNRYERTARVQRESDEDKIGRGEADVSWLYGHDVVTAPIAPPTTRRSAEVTDPSVM